MKAKEIKGGQHLSDLSSEVSAVGGSLKKGFSDFADNPVESITSPSTIRAAVSMVGASKLPALKLPKKTLVIGMPEISIPVLKFSTSSRKLNPTFVYTIYDAQGVLRKFGVSDAAGLRLAESLKDAGKGATAEVTKIMPKYRSHLMEKYLRTLHYNSTGTWELPAMQRPHPVNFETGKKIPKPKSNAKK